MFDFNALNEITVKLKETLRKNVSQNPALPPTVYELWFSDMNVLRMTDAVIFISVNTDMQKLTIENKYRSLLTDAVKEQYGLDLKLGVYHTQNGPEKFKITKETLDSHERRLLLDGVEIDWDENNGGGSLPPGAAASGSKGAADIASIINSIDGEIKEEETGKLFRFRYTFDNFVVGSSNRFAYKASVNVAQYPAVKYNPFFIYGPSGIGKTHLLCAICNEYNRRFKHMKVLYVNGVDFANELIDFITEGNRKKAQVFREKYQSCDMLLIDDIQFITGKVAVQEEIFHTFNTLYEAEKQIIFSSDRPPKDLNPLEDRIKSRFESGLIVDIQPPELELRIAILKRKAKDMQITVGNDVLFFLGENIASNIRQIEGTIKKLNAYAYLNNSPITLELAKSSIADILSGTEPINVTVEKILAAASQTFGVPQAELKGRKRTKEIALARNAAIYIIRSITDLSLPAIGKIFGRDHSTIFSAIGAVETEIKTNHGLASQIADITNAAKV